MTDSSASPRAGDAIEDYCRVCKVDREHRIIAIDAAGRPRVICGYCGSQHGYRGGASPRPATTGTPLGSGKTPAAPWPLVSQRERTHTPVMTSDDVDIELLLRRIIREEAGLTAVAPAEKWRGGELVLRPGKSGLQEKTFPIETLFHKIVMVRNRLRTLEQQVNSAEIPEDAKLKMQGYITGCYGSLTSFNVLFADEADGFSGAKK